MYSFIMWFLCFGLLGPFDTVKVVPILRAIYFPWFATFSVGHKLVLFLYQYLTGDG